MTNISTLTPPATSQTSQTPSASAQLSSNFDTFLKLLTSQLRNQDPLNPVDSAQFTQQLVQYSQVEQQINTNSKLDNLAAQLKTSTSGAALSYLGRLATFNTDAATLNGNGAAWQYALSAPAATTTLTVKDGSGNVVFTQDGDNSAGSHAFTWNGSTFGGGTAPNGTYHLQVTAKDGAGAAVQTATAVQELITGIDLSGATPNVTTASGSRTLDTLLRVESN